MEQQPQQTTPVEKPSLRKPYAKPAIIETTPLEAGAFLCSPVPPTNGKLSPGEPRFCTTIES